MFVGWARSRRWAVCVFWRLGVAGYFAAKVVNGGTRCPQRVDDNTPSAPNLTSSSEKPIHLSLSAARDGGSYNNENCRRVAFAKSFGVPRTPATTVATTLASIEGPVLCIIADA